MSSTHGQLSSTVSPKLASLIKTIPTRHVGRYVYSKFIALLYLLAALCDGRGITCSQDSGSNMGHLWFTVQIWAKWSYKTIFAAWVHYNKQTGNIKRTNQWPHKIKRTNGRERAMNMQPMLPSSSDHLLKLTKGPTFIAIMLSEVWVFLRVPSGPYAAAIAGTNMGRMSKSL